MFFRMVFFSIFPILAWIPFATAAGDTSAGGGGAPYHIKADSLDFDEVSKSYRARGNAVISRGNQTLNADAVDFNDTTKEATAWGNVRFFSGLDWVNGSRIDLNLEEGTGTVYDGTLFIEKSHFYFRGDKIIKTGKDSYFIKGAGSLTTCDGESPDWQMTGRDMKLTLEGYGTMKHPAMRVKSIPILYVPFIVYPVKIKRQSGLLMPLVGYSNKNGFEFQQPLYWAINESSDATLNEHYMDRRGVRHSVEARAVRSTESKVTAMFDYLWDHQIDDGRDKPPDFDGYWYEGFRGDSEDRINRERWWFRMKADWELPSDFDARLDMDLVSDQDYLREFVSGYGGYDSSNSYFKNEFSRELDDNEDVIRSNQFNVNKGWDQFSLNAALLWDFDTIINKNNTEDPTLQRLPFISFSGSKQEVGTTSFYYDLSSSFSHCWREVGTRGYYMDIYPRGFYPTTLLNVLDFEPSLGFRETVWFVEEYEQPSANTEDTLRSREIFDVSADLSTEISRVFDIDDSAVDKIRHAIKPQVVYNFIPDVEQGDRPDFVGEIDESNSLSYSLLNTLTSRKIASKKQDEEDPDMEEKEGEESIDPKNDSEKEDDLELQGPPQYVYHDFMRLSLSQSYDILTARRSPSDGERQPFSDVSGRLEWTPFHEVNLGFLGNAAWSPYTTDFSSYSLSTDYMNKRKDEFVLEYRYEKDGSENAFGRFLVHLTSSLTGRGVYEYNLKDNKAVNSGVGLTYSPQCWSFGIYYTHDRTMDKREYFFEISLFGLGKYELGQYRPDQGTDTWMKKG